MNSIPTVIVGSAKDVVEHVGVARFLFVDYPLGNPAGRPFDRENQMQIANLAVNLLVEANKPNTTVKAPFSWLGDNEWRQVYNRVRPEENEELLIKGDLRRKKMKNISRRKI